jgi:hypothetical protein
MPADEISDDGIVASTRVELISTVGRSDPLNRTTDEELKSVPLQVNENPLPPIVTQVGDIEFKTGTGLTTLNELDVPVSELPVLFAVIVNVPAVFKLMACEVSTPLVNEFVVFPPDDKLPVELISAVPLKTFTPLLHVLLFASLAVIFILNGYPAVCVPIIPPDALSTRKLFTIPGETVKLLLFPDLPDAVAVT